MCWGEMSKKHCVIVCTVYLSASSCACVCCSETQLYLHVMPLTTGQLANIASMCHFGYQTFSSTVGLLLLYCPFPKIGVFFSLRTDLLYSFIFGVKGIYSGSSQ